MPGMPHPASAPQLGPQTPLSQPSPGAHRLPHAPQCSRSDWVSTHAPLHISRGAPHVVPHVPPLHAVPGGQATPHAPQLSLSDCRFAQRLVPPSITQRVSSPQEGRHAPPAHTSPLSQRVPQAPQLEGSRSVSAQTVVPPSAVHCVRLPQVGPPAPASPATCPPSSCAESQTHGPRLIPLPAHTCAPARPSVHWHAWLAPGMHSGSPYSTFPVHAAVIPRTANAKVRRIFEVMVRGAPTQPRRLTSTPGKYFPRVQFSRSFPAADARRARVPLPRACARLSAPCPPSRSPTSTRPSATPAS